MSPLELQGPGRRLARSRKYRLGYSLEWYQQQIEAGNFQIHQFPLGFVITEIIQYDEERVCVVRLMGGEKFDQWKAELVSRLEIFAKAQGCNVLEAACRLGLEKKLKPLGWRRWHVVLRKEL